MKCISELPVASAQRITHVLTDIDDTLTMDGQLTSDAYGALWRLHDAGVVIIPVTGRPAGWCDCIIRQWPVDAIVGENGAFAIQKKDNTIVEFLHPAVADPEHRGRLDAVRDHVLNLVEDSRVAKDQAFRRFDLAIDFREDPPILDFSVAEKIATICRDMGAQAKISSIHVNTWFGEYDKLSMVKLLLNEEYGMNSASIRKRATFCGDSPNDEPMFAFLPLSCAVSNIHDTIGYLRHKPKFVTTHSHGRGFAEYANTILEKSALGS